MNTIISFSEYRSTLRSSRYKWCSSLGGERQAGLRRLNNAMRSEFALEHFRDTLSIIIIIIICSSMYDRVCLGWERSAHFRSRWAAASNSSTNINFRNNSNSRNIRSGGVMIIARSSATTFKVRTSRTIRRLCWAVVDDDGAPTHIALLGDSHWELDRISVWLGVFLRWARWGAWIAFTQRRPVGCLADDGVRTLGDRRWWWWWVSAAMMLLLMVMVR